MVANANGACTNLEKAVSNFLQQARQHAESSSSTQPTERTLSRVSRALSPLLVNTFSLSGRPLQRMSRAPAAKASTKSDSKSNWNIGLRVELFLQFVTNQET